MQHSRLTMAVALSALMLGFGGGIVGNMPALAQEEVAAAPAAAPAEDQAPDPLSEDELEILVARIALYPDELVAVIVSASLYPLQIVQAERYLEKRQKDANLKPDESWDGSVVSLLNYPEIVKMMSDDLDWTEAMGDAITYQQEDVLQTIQLLREKAVAKGVIKSDEKVKIVKEKEKIIIQPASAETVYIPQYAPQMLYEPNYNYVPVTYWPDPYPNYWSPVAPFFAGAVTGAIWASVIDWNDWGVWGGNNWGNNIDIDCNNCFNNNNRYNGKLNINNVDWKNVDRTKIKFDKNQINNLDRTKLTKDLKNVDRNNLKNKAADLKKDRPSTLPANKGNIKDVRKNTLEGLKKNDKMARPGQGNFGEGGANIIKPGQGGGNANIIKPGQGGNLGGGNLQKPGQGAGDKMARPGGGDRKPNIDRPVGKPRPAERPDVRPANPSPLGDINRGGKAKFDSDRGRQAMGGGMKSGSGKQKRFIPPSNRGGGGGFKGGGGRGGGGGFGGGGRRG